MATVLTFTHELPPSSNHIYINTGRGRVLTKEAKSYKTLLVSKLAREYLWKTPVLRNFRYAMHLRFWFPSVETAVWHKKVKKGVISDTDNRFNKIDLSNRVKLLEDAIMEATGLDDSCIFRQLLEKEADSQNPRVEVELIQLEGAREEICGRERSTSCGGAHGIILSEHNARRPQEEEGGAVVQCDRDSVGGAESRRVDSPSTQTRRRESTRRSLASHSSRHLPRRHH